MQTGKLDQKITLQTLTEQNNSGALIQSWTNVTPDVWGEVLSAHGQEAISAARADAKNTIRIRIRYRADLDETWRLLWDGLPYSVVAVDPSERRKGNLWITAQRLGKITA